jgi:hypothetical protein
MLLTLVPRLTKEAGLLMWPPFYIPSNHITTLCEKFVKPGRAQQREEGLENSELQ